MPEKSARARSNASGMPMADSSVARSVFDSILKRGSVRSTLDGARAAVIAAKLAASNVFSNAARSSGTMTVMASEGPA